MSAPDDELDRSIDAALSGVFGFPELWPGQRDVMLEVMAGRPVVAVMPTGAGKSLCYQLPAVLLAESGGLTVVVSPLIA
ncbi:MAG TPA: DEAD/DEAH box helicase, partial [Steroidobacteraceae bacterium]|nr:DEAD/DEAH box helicase [Steroidobacteraceae bacterium]